MEDVKAVLRIMWSYKLVRVGIWVDLFLFAAGFALVALGR